MFPTNNRMMTNQMMLRRISIIPFFLMLPIFSLLAQGSRTVDNQDQNGLNDQSNQEYHEPEYALDARTIALISDLDLRAQIFPSQYHFDLIPKLAAVEEYEVAAWHLVHLFETDAMKVFQVIDVLADKLDISNLFTKAFKTFAYADPTLMDYHGNAPVLMDPVKFEQTVTLVNTLNRYYTYQQQK